MKPDLRGCLAYLLLTAGLLIGCQPPHLSGRTILAAVLITAGGVLLVGVIGRVEGGGRA